MTRGRKPSGVKLVEKLDGSDSAKEKLSVLLQTLTGEKSVKEACEELGIGEAMFHRLRSSFLQDSVDLLEPKTRGRKKKAPDPSQEKIKALEREIEDLELDLDAAYARTEIALVMPHILTEDAKKLKKRPKLLNDLSIEDIENSKNMPPE
jgi:transposase-like protein